MLCVFLGFGYYFLFAALELCYFAFVSFYNLFKAFFLLVYFLAFLFPVTFVAYNVLQVFVALYVFCSSNFRSVGYHVFGYAYLARNLYCERTARLPDLQLEERLHFCPVVKHGSVHHSHVFVGVVFQVLVVCGYYAVCAGGYEAFQYGFGQCSAYERLCSAAELVDEQQALGTCVFHHNFHVEQVGGIGAQLVFYALLVADVDEQPFENAYLGVFAHGYRHAALNHVLQKSHGFQAYGFAAGIRSGYD